MYWPDWCHAKFRWLQALCSIMIVKFVNDYGTALMHVNHLPECDAPRVHETYETDKSCIARLQQATHNQWFRFLRPLLWELHLLSIPFMQHGGANHCPNRLVSSRVKLFSLCNDCMDASWCLCPTHGVWRWNSAPDLLSRGSSGAFGMAWTHLKIYERQSKMMKHVTYWDK